MSHRLPDVDFLTVADAARRLRVSKMTVYRAIDFEQLRAYRVGRQFRIDERDFVEYMRGISTIRGAA